MVQSCFPFASVLLTSSISGRMTSSKQRSIARENSACFASVASWRLVAADLFWSKSFMAFSSAAFFWSSIAKSLPEQPHISNTRTGRMQWPPSALPCGRASPGGDWSESRPLLGVRRVEVGQEVREIPHLLYVVQVPGIERRSEHVRADKPRHGTQEGRSAADGHRDLVPHALGDVLEVLVHRRDDLPEPAELQPESGQVELRHVEADVDQVLRVSLERLHDVEATTRSRRAKDFEEDVVGGVPIAVREHNHPAPFEVSINMPQEPEHHVGLHTRKRRVLDDPLLASVIETADRHLHRR